MLHWEIIGVIVRIIQTHNAEFPGAEAGGAYSYHWTLNG